mmetsp:Transcript_1960/g.6123  ORF Transcript_1960/g.6123 Transcript_1960/m.6123 type:complete len:204 (+) Transcript_1960:722-1333(+)
MAHGEKPPTTRGEPPGGVRAKCSSPFGWRGSSSLAISGLERGLSTASGCTEEKSKSMTDGDRGWADKSSTMRVTSAGSFKPFHRASETSHTLPSSTGRETRRLPAPVSHLIPTRTSSRHGVSFTNLYSRISSSPCSESSSNHTGTREIQRGYVAGQVRSDHASSSPSSLRGLHSPNSALAPNTWRASPGRVEATHSSKTTPTE